MQKKNKNNQITLPNGRFGFLSLDVSDNDEPKYQIRDPYEQMDKCNPPNKWTVRRLFSTTFEHSFPINRRVLANSLR